MKFWKKKKNFCWLHINFNFGDGEKTTGLIMNFCTVTTQSFQTNRSEQTVETRIRLLWVWSGSTLFAIPSAFLGAILYGKSILVKF